MNGVNYNNYGVRMLEKGKLMEALSYFQRAGEALVKPHSIDLDDTEEQSRKSKRVIFWSEPATDIDQNDDDLYILCRGAIILPASDSLRNTNLAHSTILLYNLGLAHQLCHQVDAALECYSEAQQVLHELLLQDQHTHSALLTLEIGLVNNMAVLLAQNVNAQAATECFRYILARLAALTAMNRPPTLLRPQDSEGILLNTLFESSCALAA